MDFYLCFIWKTPNKNNILNMYIDILKTYI
jgi:hypothetical protein